MEALQAFVAVALAEVRSARRLARTWLFAALVVVAGLLMYFQYTFLHAMFSGTSSVVGVVNPRFILAGLGVFAVWALVVVVVFLAFDVRARDARERVADTLDTRPIGNLTLLGGRLAGLVLVAWMPLLATLLLVQGLGALLASLADGFGKPIDWRSLAILLFVDAPPTLALWCSLVILLAVVVRNRLAVAVIALALLGAQAWFSFRTPYYLTQALSGVAVALQASDVQPRFVEGAEWLQRGCQYLLAGGFLWLAAAFHPRADQGARTVQAAIGGGLAALACAGIAALVAAAGDGIAQRTLWASVHEGRQGEAVPDLQRIDGRIAIEPGDVLRLDLQYAATAPEGARALLFTLNPAMRVGALSLDGEDAPFQHENGLLTVPLPAGAGPEVKLSIAASGVPDPAFAYLDASIDLPSLVGPSPLLLMGTEASMFEDDYVALLPGTFWMPTPGVAVGREDPNKGRDFFFVDLEVEVPAAWLVAGPGRREGEAGRFRFRPSAPLPEVGLVASRFERFAVEVADVDLEVLVSPVHVDSVRQFADAAEEIETALQELLSTAARWGLPYPYGGLSLVETPAHLRTFRGGWRMDTLQTLPGVLMLRETGLPTANFFATPGSDLEEIENQGVEGGIPRFKRNRLRQFFQNDVAGGNPLHGAVRNLLSFQTSASGAGAAAMNFLVHDLAVQLVTGSRSGFFSPYLLRTQDEFQQSMLDTVTAMVGGRAGSFGGSVYMGSTRRPSVWDRALGASLKDLNPRDDPESALNVLWLKGPELAQAMMDGLGRESVAAFLAELRRRHAGGTFTEQDFDAVATAVGIDFETLLGDWLDSAALPGFVLSPVRLVRLRDDDQGRPRYQVGLHVYNDEPVPGLVRLTYGEWQGEDIGWVSDATPPTRVAAKSAVELGLVATNLPEQLQLAPYLALNRSAVTLPLPEVDQTESVDAEPFSGARPSTWRPERQAGIVVDDLDEGFSVRVDEIENGPRLGGGKRELPPNTEIDQGLPVFSPQQIPGWTRQEQDGAVGKYRRTLARSRSGDGSEKAVFGAELPSRGRWRLEYHLPPMRSFSFAMSFGVATTARSDSNTNQPQGAYDLRILAAGNETKIDFDAGAGQLGWNRLGDFDLPAGEVQVQVSNRTAGNYVVADAIRWLPLDDR